jgi:hypothetical protein
MDGVHPRVSERPFLICVSAGDTSLHEQWIVEERNFDIALFYYGCEPVIANRYAGAVEYFISANQVHPAPISKFVKLDRLVDEVEKICGCESYSHIWMPDDDIQIDACGVNQLFEIAVSHGLFLCQPALGGFLSHDVTKKNNGSKLRFTNFVEVMAPLMSWDIYQKLRWTFSLSESSWGLDYLWPYILGYPSDKIAVIDSVAMIHTRPVGSDYSRFPKSPPAELDEILLLIARALVRPRVIASISEGGT